MPRFTDNFRLFGQREQFNRFSVKNLIFKHSCKLIEMIINLNVFKLIGKPFQLLTIKVLMRYFKVLLII